MSEQRAAPPFTSVVGGFHSGELRSNLCSPSPATIHAATFASHPSKQPTLCALWTAPLTSPREAATARSTHCSNPCRKRLLFSPLLALSFRALSTSSQRDRVGVLGPVGRPLHITTWLWIPQINLDCLVSCASRILMSTPESVLTRYLLLHDRHWPDTVDLSI